MGKRERDAGLAAGPSAPSRGGSVHQRPAVTGDNYTGTSRTSASRTGTNRTSASRTSASRADGQAEAHPAQVGLTVRNPLLAVIAALRSGSSSREEERRARNTGSTSVGAVARLPRLGAHDARHVAVEIATPTVTAAAGRLLLLAQASGPGHTGITSTGPAPLGVDGLLGCRQILRGRVPVSVGAQPAGSGIAHRRRRVQRAGRPLAAPDPTWCPAAGGDPARAATSSSRCSADRRVRDQFLSHGHPPPDVRPHHAGQRGRRSRPTGAPGTSSSGPGSRPECVPARSCGPAVAFTTRRPYRSDTEPFRTEVGRCW